MSTKHLNLISKLHYIRIPSIGILLFCFMLSCGGEKKEYVSALLNNETMPSMRDDSVTMFISDSGLIKYKLVTKNWEFFENAKDPHWFFPEGIYLEKFDTTFHIQTSLKADTAWNFTLRKLWRLKGNVFIRNIQDETFSTDELFWDERQQKVYSDKYIEIVKPDKLTLKGIGFESNMGMTQYRIFKPHKSDIYLNDTPKTEPAN